MLRILAVALATACVRVPSAQVCVGVAQPTTDRADATAWASACVDVVDGRTR